jgi:hypothetical protein
MSGFTNKNRVDVVALIIRKNSEILVEKRRKDRRVDPGKTVIPEGTSKIRNLLSRHARAFVALGLLFMDIVSSFCFLLASNIIAPIIVHTLAAPISQLFGSKSARERGAT